MPNSMTSTAVKRKRANKYETLENMASQQWLFTCYNGMSEKATKCSLVIANNCNFYMQSLQRRSVYPYFINLLNIPD